MFEKAMGVEERVFNVDTHTTLFLLKIITCPRLLSCFVLYENGTANRSSLLPYA